MLTNQRHELIRGDQERDRINKAKQPQDNETRESVIISTGKKFLEDDIHAAENVERSTPNVQFYETAIRNPHSSIRNQECQGGELNSRPTPNAFGDALLA